MKKRLKVALLSILGLLAVLVVALQVVLNSRIVTDAIDRFAQNSIEGTLSYSRPKVYLLRAFPSIRVRLDSVALTYPYSMFVREDDGSRLYGACGRGEEADTLAAFDRLTVEVNPYSLLGRKLDIRRCELDGFRAFVHVYDSLSNLNVLKFGGGDGKDGEEEPAKAFAVSLGSLRIASAPRLVYDDRTSNLSAQLSFRELGLGGTLFMDDGGLYFRDSRARLDSLRLHAAIDADTLACSVPEFAFSQPSENVFDLSLVSELLLALQDYGDFAVPFTLDGRLAADKKKDSFDFRTDGLRSSLAHIPLAVEGSASIRQDSIPVNAVLRVESCPLDTLRQKYAAVIMPMLKQFSTDALLSADLEADGVFSAGKWPNLDFCLRIPRSHTSYLPENITAELVLDLDAVMSPDKLMDADIHEFCLKVPGVDLDLAGGALDLLGKDPRYKLSATAEADLCELVKIVPESLGITEASGDMSLELNASTRRSELASYRFDEADISGRLTSRSLAVAMEEDSLNAVLFNSDVALKSGRSGLDLKVDFDSLYFNNGVNFITRIRNIRNEGHISKTNLGGKVLPKVTFSSTSERMFLKSGSGRYGLRGTDMAVSLQKIVPNERDRRNRERRMPAFLQDEDFELADIDISLDSSLVNYLRSWSTEGHVRADGGYFSSPALPLRTRMRALDAGMNDREIVVEALSVESGTSDITVCGYVRGIKKALMGKSKIDAYLLADSRRINANELMAAFLVGKEDFGNVTVEEELDESFVTDTLADAKVDIKDLPLFVVPGNVDLTLKLNAERVDFSEPKIRDFSTGVKIKDRTMQLTSTNISTDIGDVVLDAFYSTRTKNDISAGLNLNMKDMRADEIISLIPAIDSIMPALKIFEGRLGLELSATARLDTNMNVIIPTLDGVTRIRGEELRIHDKGQLGRLPARFIFGKKPFMDIENLAADAIIHDSKLEVFPFILSTDRFRFALRGTQNFDKTMYYHASVLKSPMLVRFGVNVFGSLDNLHFSLGRAKYRDGQIPAYSAQLDTVQINLSKSIRNIFRRGVDDVMRRNVNALSSIDERNYRVDPLYFDDDEMAAAEIESYVGVIENFVYEQELEDQNESIMREVNEALEESFVDMSAFLGSYQNSIFDRRMQKKMERMKRRDARKADRAARRAS